MIRRIRYRSVGQRSNQKPERMPVAEPIIVLMTMPEKNVAMTPIEPPTITPLITVSDKPKPS